MNSFFALRRAFFDKDHNGSYEHHFRCEMWYQLLIFFISRNCSMSNLNLKNRNTLWSLCKHAWMINEGFYWIIDKLQSTIRKSLVYMHTSLSTSPSSRNCLIKYSTSFDNSKKRLWRSIIYHHSLDTYQQWTGNVFNFNICVAAEM